MNFTCILTKNTTSSTQEVCKQLFSKVTLVLDCQEGYAIKKNQYYDVNPNMDFTWILTKKATFLDLPKVPSHLEVCFYLISGSSLHKKIQIMGWKITENLGFKSPLHKVNFFCPFFFSFSSSPKTCVGTVVIR